jgi:hypothetical protein
MYRKNKGLEYRNVKTLSVEKAYKIMDIFLSINDAFVIRNKESRNQHWRLYKNGYHTILACFQDTYQQIQTNKLGWMTGWFESPSIPETIRHAAIIELSESVNNLFQYIWANKKWISNSNREDWKEDGQFHWYLYQWATNVSVGTSYCIMM